MDFATAPRRKKKERKRSFTNSAACPPRVLQESGQLFAAGCFDSPRAAELHQVIGSCSVLVVSPLW